MIEQVTGLRLPNEQEEQTNPAAVDEVYEAAVKSLIERTRGQQFPLLFEENIAYGFRRNLFAYRKLGLGISILGVYCTLLVFILRWGDVLPTPPLFCLLVGAMNAFLSLFWWRVVTEGWVREAADRYAERLLGTVEKLAFPDQDGAPGLRG